MFLLWLLFVLSTLSQVITYDDIEKPKTINFVHQNSEVLNNHKTFTESQAEILIEMNFCLPLEIQYIINNMTKVYKNIDTKHLTEALFLTKLSKDLQNHKPFCDAIKDATSVYVKRMSFLLNMKYYKPDIAKDIKQIIHDYNINKRCLDIKLDNMDKPGIFKCIKDTERRALFNALRQ